MKQINKKIRYLLILNILVLFLTLIIKKWNKEQINKLINNSQKNINKELQEELRKTLTELINWTELYKKIFYTFGAVGSTLALINLFFNNYLDVINVLNKKTHDNLKLSKKEIIMIYIK